MLRSRPPVDSAAATIGWPEEMEEMADRRGTGRFKREPHTAGSEPLPPEREPLPPEREPLPPEREPLPAERDPRDALNR